MRTPMPFSLLRARAASGVCGCRWISTRSSRMPASFLSIASSASPLCSWRRGSLGVAAEALQHRVVGVDRGLVILLLVGDFAQIKLRRAGQVVQRIVVHDVLKLALRHLVARRRCSRARRPGRSPAAAEPARLPAFAAGAGAEPGRSRRAGRVPAAKRLRPAAGTGAGRCAAGWL